MGFLLNAHCNILIVSVSGTILVDKDFKNNSSLQILNQIVLTTNIVFYIQIIDIMEDKVGVPLKVLVKRSNNKSIALTVVPEESVG